LDRVIEKLGDFMLDKMGREMLVRYHPVRHLDFAEHPPLHIDVNWY
jgi:hypothetical protein